MPIPPIQTTHRNYLPHWTTTNAIYFVTFRLADSLPTAKLRAWQSAAAAFHRLHPTPLTDAQQTAYDTLFGTQLDKWLDAGHGSQALARPEIRAILQQSLLRFDADRLNLHAAVIMPTHIHALLEPLGDNQLSTLLKGIKGASARQINTLLGQTGKFWMEESYDHIVRTEAQYEHYRRYIQANPTKAHLSKTQYWLHLTNQSPNPPHATNQ